MRLNVEFIEGKRHAWLVTNDSVELFIHQPMDCLSVTNGWLTCRLPSDLAEEIREDDTSDDEPTGVYLCCAGDRETKLYKVDQSVTYSGGDVLLFLSPIATFH